MAGRHGGHLPRAAPWLGEGKETQGEGRLLRSKEEREEQEREQEQLWKGKSNPRAWGRC